MRRKRPNSSASSASASTSAFLVAKDQVDVISRGAGADESWMWSSTADDTWTITPLKELTERGTAVVLHLKEGMDSYLNDWTLRQLVKTTRSSSLSRSRCASRLQEDEEERAWEAASTRLRRSGAAANRRSRTRSTVSSSRTSTPWLPGKPMTWTHFRIEGGQQFTGLLYLPEQAPAGMQFVQQQSRVRLYVKRVFIMDEVGALVPAWLRFVSG